MVLRNAVILCGLILGDVWFVWYMESLSLGYVGTAFAFWSIALVYTLLTRPKR